MAEAGLERGRLAERPPFRAVLTGAQALVRAIFDTRTRTAVICPGVSFSEYKLFRYLSRQNKGMQLCEPTSEKTAIHEAIRAAMAGGLTVLFCRAGQGPGIREALRQLGGLDLQGGLVLVGEDSHDSQQQDRDDIGDFGNLPDPACPGEIYRFYKLAAGLASGRRIPVALRVASRLWGEAETVSCDGAGTDSGEKISSGSRIIPMPGGDRGKPGGSSDCGNLRQEEGDADRRQALLCRDCRHGTAVGTVTEILADCDIAVLAMACHGPVRHAEIGSSLPPAQGCGASGIRIETSGGTLLVCAGNPGLPQWGELAEEDTLVVFAMNPDQPGR